MDHLEEGDVRLWPSEDEPPLRAELLSVEQLARYAAELAGIHEISKGGGLDRLIPRLNENENLLIETYDLILAAVRNKVRVAPAGDWLLDNFYVIENQIRSIREHLPRSYSRQLPRLAAGPGAGYPRVCGMALELVSHVDGGVDEVNLTAFITAYQSRAELKLGELWAIPIMLRFSLIENLRRVALRLGDGQRERDLANEWAERITEVVERNPSELINTLSDLARGGMPLTSAFLAELTRHLHGQSPHFSFVHSWLEHRLSAQGLKIEELVQSETQMQAADQVSIGNSITSLRFLAALDWREFVESQSVVEHTLREDPADIYELMDFASRDLYRHAVETIARYSPVKESDVARKALELAVAGVARLRKHMPSEVLADPEGPEGREGHIGYYLIGKGRVTLEQAVKMKATPRVLLRRVAVNHPLAIYLGAALALTALTTWFLVHWARGIGMPGWAAWSLIVPAEMCVFHVALGLVNWLVTLYIGPRPLARMDYRSGIPIERKTMVVVPTMLGDADSIRELLERLEVYFLANHDDNLHFAILTDYKDAATETMPGDEALVRVASEGIELLNQKYIKERGNIFFLFHRPRVWTPGEGKWMGFERKRGKLKELNAALRGGSLDRFALVEGDVRVLNKIRYVITLDTDTQLPRDAARRMVGAMSHPLNRPVFDESRCRVVDGYAIMQPRLDIGLMSASRSWFVRLFTTEVGLDPYTRMVSDVYQDAFGEGSFVGKGIYDVEAFEKACANFPDNRVLSHDLLESAYARSALLSDVIVYEDFPSHYLTDVSRRHRWMRGDWQIMWWLLPRVPSPQKWVANTISPLAWWKIFDNLRRSLVAPAMVAVLLIGWALPWAYLAEAATVFVLASIGTTLLLAAILSVVNKPKALPLGMHLMAAVSPVLGHLGQILFTVVFLPYDAMLSLDAIGRTMARMLITRKNMLEWTTAHDADRAARGDVWGMMRKLWSAPVFALLVLAALTWGRPGNLAAAAPMILLWVVSPLVAWWLSKPIAALVPQVSDDQKLMLGKLARRTWRYFETFVTAQENWLPPDNFQEPPKPTIAARTSPTNIGLALLANLAAYDFGYCSVAQVIDRTEKTMATMARMDRHRGHFYNWYDTRTLDPLPPRYISTVDSGNLAGHLIVLRSGLLELIDAPILPPRLFSGLRDTLGLVHEVAQPVSNVPGAGVDLRALRERAGAAEALIGGAILSPPALRPAMEFLRRVMAPAGEIAALPQGDAEFAWWSEALRGCLSHHDADLTRLAPWALLPPPPETLEENREGEALERVRELRKTLEALAQGPTLREVAQLKQTVTPLLERIVADWNTGNAANGSGNHTAAREWCAAMRRAVEDAATYALERIHTLEDLAENCQELSEMDFTFLLDKSRKLFSIGYNATSQRLDGSYYDLLGSEARVASYFAIAQGQVDQEQWFALGRLLTTTGGAPALLSWSGSMFEYLMPLTVMPNYPGTLIDYTYKAVVKRQIDYGKQRGVPWGISESAYNATDAQLTYQYGPFGVPGLGLKRGLAEDLVIAPYATVMALMVDPEKACANLDRLRKEGQLGAYGFYEAVDYTPGRLPHGAESVTVRSYMGHHLGMSLLSLDYLINDQPMQRRFSSDPRLRAADLLLQERVPKATAPVFPHAVEANTVHATHDEGAETIRIITELAGPVPDIHLLSNGRYHVMVSAAGGGYSRWRELAIMRWREDPTRDCWGMFCYVRDVESGKFWSSAHQPTLKAASSYEAIFTQAKAEFRRRDDDIETHTEISVSPEDDIELRRVTVTNRSDRPRTIELTSYGEVVLSPPIQDQAHPAFGNLFVQTELDTARHAVLCSRRPRSSGERPPWMVHLMTLQGTARGETTFETDRIKFIGRGNSLAEPAAMKVPRLSNSAGPVLDPAVAIRRTVRLAAGESAKIGIVTGIADTREAAEALIEKYHDSRLSERVYELAWTHSHVVLQHLNATEGEAQLYGRLAGSIVYTSTVFRAAASVLARNRRGQSGLWGYGISGDLPIMLVRIREAEKLDLVRQALQAHAYWRTKGLVVDLVIWNEDDSVYRQDLHEIIMGFIAATPETGLLDQPGGVFVRRGDQIPEEDRVLIQTAARVVLVDDGGTLRDQIDQNPKSELPVAGFRASRKRTEIIPSPPLAQRELVFFNGLGGFTRDGREYITTLLPGQQTPAPWVNVIANDRFGTVVSESGGVYTWGENAHEFRLTPWRNDTVGAFSEAIYLRDAENGRVWSPTPQPATGNGPYVARHGFGYTTFEHTEDGIETELIIYVAMNEPVKFARLKIVNRSGRQRQFAVTNYSELALGELRARTLMHVATQVDPVTSAIFARNPFHPEFGNQVAFTDCSETVRSVSGDRLEFLGRNGTAARPAAMNKARLSGRVGPGLDPCFAMQAQVAVEDGREKVVVFTLGEASSEEEARQIIQRTRGIDNAQKALEGVWDFWARTLGTLYLESPDPAVNFLVNGWLPYQTLCCRMWARTGFYQSGGAYGFRDQLQDAMALLHTAPELLRSHILKAASRQFIAGDVQHWWHPQSGRGVRSHCSDDYLWLAAATCRYVGATGDTGVWDEKIQFLDGRAVRPEEEGYYDLPQVAEEQGTLYEHCVRAINNGLQFGVHGLPLMGSGDWNDGMNLVGEHGKGESVWLAFYLYDVLTRFAQHARKRGDTAFADKCLAQAGTLRLRIEDSSWDGAWYKRAYFDDGTPLGSHENDECQIDALPQSWSVLSGAGDRNRALTAMDSVHQRLVRRDPGMIFLFNPPFDKSALNPGYIKGYIPGVRENGGQYTHAAIWTVMAFAALGETERAWELLTLINPISHASTPEAMETYKVEPYVVAADVYAVPPHTGRGGWTWYTGSAGWMYRLITESILGVNLEVDSLRFTPCLPPHWKEFKIHYRYRSTFYHIVVRNGGGGKFVRRVATNGLDQPDQLMKLIDDGQTHDVEVDIE